MDLESAFLKLRPVGRMQTEKRSLRCRSGFGMRSGCMPSAPLLRMVSLFRRQMKVHRLEADAAGAGEPVPDHLAGAGKNAGGEPLEHGLHSDAGILVNPTPGLNINLFARP